MAVKRHFLENKIFKIKFSLMRIQKLRMTQKKLYTMSLRDQKLDASYSKVKNRSSIDKLPKTHMTSFFNECLSHCSYRRKTGIYYWRKLRLKDVPEGLGRAFDRVPSMSDNRKWSEINTGFNVINHMTTYEKRFKGTKTSSLRSRHS